jgi:omega-6 fatty acid desaturase (delta-12 desaturase)
MNNTARSEENAFQLTRPYAHASYTRSIWQLGNTLTFYGVTIALMFATVDSAYAVTLGLSVLASVGYLRLFMIGHDTAHDSFMPLKWQNAIVGNLLGVLTNTPIGYWARQHHLHHQGNGNLDKRGDGDVETMTLEEFRRASLPRRIWYRIYRNPIFLFGIAAPVHFVVMQRYPMGHQSKTLSGWASVLGTNLGIALYYASLIALFGIERFLWVYVPVVMLSSAGAVWLFYVQHQYPGTYFRRQRDWSYQKAALEGSSFYDLPRLLHWCCANIGFHHIHHLNPKVPNYRLPACHAQNESFAKATHLSIRDSLPTANLALWHEEEGKLVTFREAGMTRARPWSIPADGASVDALLADPEARA